MTKTLLAVDDSATMRKVLEITFSGEEFKVLTAEGQQSALDKLNDRPDVCVIDTTLGSDDGYALSREIRKRDPKAVIVMLASKHAPYDQSKGKDCGADDFVDKPFDTQQMIDKVKKAILTRTNGTVEAAPSSVNVPAAAAAAAPAPAAVMSTPSAKPAAAPATAANTSARPAPAAAAPVATSERARIAGNDTAGARPFAAVAAASTGPIVTKLEGLGLTSSQQDAVLAISREMVERVVWEVVPQLAEALIKEEIARLMK